MSQLKKQTVRGVAILGAGKGLGRLISFANTIILARILSPEDYGLMAMAMVVCGFIAFFNEIGLGSAIIQRKDVTEKQLNGAFSIAVLASIGLYGVTYLIAPYVGTFYNNSQITEMLVVLAISFITGAFSTVSNALISKNMQFKALAGIELVSIVTQAFLTLIFALLGYEAWSLVYGFVISQFIRSVLVYKLAGWQPTKFGAFNEAFPLIKFGLTVTYSRLTWYAYSNAATFIVGKISGEKQLGIYSMAATLADLPTSHLTSLIRQVASPVFAKLQEDLSQLNKMLYGFTAGLSLITFPLLAGIIVTAPELIPILLGEQWLDVIFPMQVLALVGFFRSLSPLLTQALTSVGKVNITAKYTTICSIVVPLAVFMGVTWQGINGVAIALCITYSVLTILLLLLCRQHINLSLQQYFVRLVTPFSGSLVMVLGVYITNTILTNYLNVIFLFIIEVIVGVVVYCWWLIYIRKDGLKQFKSVLVDMGIGQKKLGRWPFTRIEID
ncbi:MAG: lipopolysaccharide biosynthesis protein [Colwellia sp.]|nr:lipopolysaccharide biosynthesis protein [Colwellia sp.]